MYGLVNRGVEDMARSAGGQALWDRIRTAAGVDDEIFLAMKSYPDEITYRLVDAASAELDLPAEEILRLFGRHWIVYTAQEGYGPLLAMGGRTLPSFLRNLDAMHVRVATEMPELRPPSFVVTEIDDHLLRVDYRSHRDGLAPMVVGLLEGLGELFDTPVAITPVEESEGAGSTGFLVRHG